MLMDRLKPMGWGIVAETPTEFEAGSLCAKGHGCGNNYQMGTSKIIIMKNRTQICYDFS